MTITGPKFTLAKLGDLSERFDNHHTMTCIKQNNATHIGIYTTGMEIKVARQAAERDLLARNSTPCNG